MTVSGVIIYKEMASVNLILIPKDGEFIHICIHTDAHTHAHTTLNFYNPTLG